jgi:nicotinamidase-related amidase
MDALLVVDMQEGLLRGDPKHDVAGVVGRINSVAKRVRQGGGVVFFVQHAGPVGDDFEPRTDGWRLLSSLAVEASDRVVSKTLNDPFFGTSLQADLAALGVNRVVIAGWATDLCVDATVRAAAALGYEVVVGADCHTVSDRPHLNAERIIEHHHWVWTNLLARRPVIVARAGEMSFAR